MVKWYRGCRRWCIYAVVHGPLVCELWPRYHNGLATGDTLIRHPTATRPPGPLRSPTLCPIGNGFSEPPIYIVCPNRVRFISTKKRENKQNLYGRLGRRGRTGITTSKCFELEGEFRRVRREWQWQRQVLSWSWCSPCRNGIWTISTVIKAGKKSGASTGLGHVLDGRCWTVKSS